MIAECVCPPVADDPETINEKTAPERYLSAWAESHSAPLALVSLDQKLIWANSLAAAVFAAGEPFVVRDGVLTAADKVQAAALRGFFERLGETSEAWIVGAHVLRAEDGARAIAINLFSTEPAQRYVWTNFGEAFRLTRAEVEVAKRILEGSAADEAAEGLGVSVETVRTHIRSLYGKLSINSRERLFALISPFRIG